MSGEQTILTIGHGRHEFKYFLELLRSFGVKFVCDVRSVARSRWPHFNGIVLSELLFENGIGYEHLPECGGRTRAAPEDLAWGIERIIEVSSEIPTVLMCSESWPLSQHKLPRANCHRIGMLSPKLRSRGVGRIVHILPDGRSIQFDESSVPSIW